MISFMEKEITIPELLAIGFELELIFEGDKMGPQKMVELVEDEKWTYAETERRLEKLFPREAIIIITPQGYFDHGDPGPLLEILRKGEAGPELQAWIADLIEEGAFAQRQKLIKRREAMGDFGDAIEDLDFVETLLRERGPKRGAHERAMQIVALRHHVHIEKLRTYFKRGEKDRHRVRKRLRSPFEL